MGTKKVIDTYPVGRIRREWHFAVAILAASLLLMAGLIAVLWNSEQGR